LLDAQRNINLPPMVAFLAADIHLRTKATQLTVVHPLPVHLAMFGHPLFDRNVLREVTEFAGRQLCFFMFDE
jgi:hypothetical protein